MEETQVHALDYLSVVRRRKWWLVVPIAGSAVVGLALVRYLPKEYRSNTTLGVSAPMVSPNVVGQSALDNPDRIRAITQQLMSTPILARVIREEAIGSGAANEAEVAMLRKSISITVPDPVAATEPRRLDTFIVSYSDAEPARAQRLANRVATVFVDENSKSRAEHAEDTSAFIATQLRASEARLATLEGQLRKAKEAHMGQLPEQTQANLQTLSGLRLQLQAQATALHSEQDRLSMIERQIEGLQQGSGEVLVFPRGTEGPQTAEGRLTALQRELAETQAIYTEKHPDVQRLQEAVASARRDAAAERQRPVPDRMASLQLDPAYRQLVADREMENLRIRDLQRASTDTEHQIGQYQARVEEAPMVEQQFATVERNYDLERAQYTDLTSKLHAASIAESMERNRGGELFTILYPASYPFEPTKPIPLRVMLLSILAGLCGGVGLALGREYLDRSVHDVRGLKDEFQLPVLGEIARL
jgi:polysaccharide chain length determinant protein (PEP-CTERM system associated)